MCLSRNVFRIIILMFLFIVPIINLILGETSSQPVTSKTLSLLALMARCEPIASVILGQFFNDKNFRSEMQSFSRNITESVTCVQFVKSSDLYF